MTARRCKWSSVAIVLSSRASYAPRECSCVTCLLGPLLRIVEMFSIADNALGNASGSRGPCQVNCSSVCSSEEAFVSGYSGSQQEAGSSIAGAKEKV